MRKAFTLVELLVVVAIIALLLGILLPALSKAKEVARRSVCMSSLNQMSTATFAYATANKGWTPDWGGVNADDAHPWYNASRNLQKSGVGPVVIGKTMEYEFLPENPAITYCPSRDPEGRYAERARDYGWISWGSDQTNWELGRTVEYSYQHRLARQLGDVDAGEAFGGDLAIVDNFRLGTGRVIYNMSVGAQICHGDEYYNVAFFDNSVRPVFDKDEELYDPSAFYNKPGPALNKLEELD